MTDERVALVVEDDDETRLFVQELLAEVGVAGRAARSLSEARRAVAREPFDLLVVDRMLPDGSGLDLARERRELGDATPILVLTALRDVVERVEGLDAGADDYLGKPFAALELKARVRALLRRGGRSRRRIVSGRLVLDADRSQAFVDGRELPLTAREFALLEALVGLSAVRREELLESVWGEATAETSASLDVIVSRLRKKLGERGLGEALQTVRGQGFRWNAS